ncbi:ABC transporter substrate-binding protein [Sphingosinicella sp. LHD-64]|uniref:ABC transporter substrate-binding protein n=1 Tax=Sphingosinicella sp. LHD-64 TaxID=3072139 RepID=UPI00280C5EC2|nr:ABC transporter substrate-binding protein [Sphingosinicella sp. LHD-64]MDQ8754826.1 ABC transporter substrate-binding protein [Sphingosinicella sp. LHD-64]
MAAPARVASLNLCTDELVLALAAPDQIASVTHLAQDPAETPLWREARRYRRNDGSLLSVAALRPDLVVTMGGGARDRLRIAERLGIPTIDLPFAASLDDTKAGIRRLAAALGRVAAGDALIRQISALQASTPPAQAEAIWLGGGGRTVSAVGLEAQWMALAGLRQRPLRGDRVGLETLLARPPQILLRSDYRQGQYSAAQRWLTHPAAARVRGARTIATDGRRWTCMGPPLIGEIHRLRREIAR